MKYFLDTEFIESSREQCIKFPFKWKKIPFIDLISIAIVREDGKTYSAISSEYNYNEASDWVKENVIEPLYLKMIHGDQRSVFNATNFHKFVGKENYIIKNDLFEYFGCRLENGSYHAPEDIEIYGYYADYDWVVFCSLFGRMIDLPKGFPMYCRDLKQMLDEKAEGGVLKLSSSLRFIKAMPDYPKQDDEHDAIADAKWNKKLYDFIKSL